MAKKPSIGRQKIKIAKIEIKNHLQVTFSKRRSGLFKKASELCILCGVEIAIIVFSPAGKVFSFGHPNVEPIVDRFLSRVPHPVSNAMGGSSAGVPEMNIQLTQIMAESEVEKKRGEILENIRKERRRQYWWEAPISELGLHELEQVMNAMDELKKNVAAQVGRIMVEAVNNTPMFLAMNGMTFDLIEETKPQTIMFNANNTLQTFGFEHEFF